MPFKNMTDYQRLLGNYLVTGLLEPKPSLGANLKLTNESKADYLAQVFYSDVKQLDPMRRLELVQQLAMAVQIVKTKHQDVSVKERLKLFKKAIIERSANIADKHLTHNWKDCLLELPLKIHQAIYNLELSANLSADKPVKSDVPRSYTFFSNQRAQLDTNFTSIGTNYCSNRLASDAPNHCLDAVFAAEINNSNATDLIVALADGAGGHHLDVQQDTAIARTAYFAARAATRALAICKDAAEVINLLPALIKNIQTEIKLKQGKYKESTTLLVARAFKVGSGYKLVGFNLGDAALFAWQPEKQFLQVIAGGARVKDVSGGFGTALLPDGYKINDVQQFNMNLPTGTVLLLLSDGIHDYLPGMLKDKQISQVTLREKEFDQEKLVNLLSAVPLSSSAAPYVNALTKAAFKQVERERKKRLETVSQAKQSYATLLEKINQLEKPYREAINDLEQKEMLQKDLITPEELKQIKFEKQKAEEKRQQFYQSAEAVQLKQELQENQVNQFIYLGDDATAMGMRLN